VQGPIEQATFLRRLGIDARAETLKKAARLTANTEVDSALARLTSQDKTGMGKMFKAIAFANPFLGVLPGFEIEQPDHESRDQRVVGGGRG
jgi:NADH dehydrogenase [ubiquinone] 1 alpha subcomplex assembly factor 7